MKKIEINIAHAPEIAQRIYKFALQQGLTEQSTYEELKTAAEAFVEANTGVLPSELDTFSFYDSQMYGAGTDEGDMLNLMIGLDGFLSSIKNILLNRKVSKTEIKGIKLPASPRKEAYSYTGHNKLNIGRSETSYAWRFEKVS